MPQQVPWLPWLRNRISKATLYSLGLATSHISFLVAIDIIVLIQHMQMSQSPRSIGLRSNGSFLMTIGALETHDIYTIQDLKKHVQGVSGVPWHQIVVWDGQSGLAFDNTHELPDMAYSELEINVLRVYFSLRHSHKSNGAHMSYVCTSSLVKDECAGHGLPVGDGTMIMYGWCIVSLPFDTFECLDVANGDTLYIEDRRTNGLSKTTEKQIVSSK